MNREVKIKITKIETSLEDYLAKFTPGSVHKVIDTGDGYALYGESDYCIFYNEAEVIRPNNKVGGELL